MLMLSARENAAIASSHPLLASKLMTFLAEVSQVEQTYFLEAELNRFPSRPIQIAVLVTESVQIAEGISETIEEAYGQGQPARVRIFQRGSPEYLSLKVAGIAPFYDREWNTRLRKLPGAIPPKT